MNPSFLQVAIRIRGEIEDLDRTVRRVVRAWEESQTTSGQQDLFLDSVALNLQGWYSGVERLFELIAREVDGFIPTGASWHQDLLGAMKADVDGIRPAVLSSETAVRLDEYRRFRHLVRNVYATNLLPERLAVLVDLLPELWDRVRAELSAIAEFLQAASS